MMRRGETRLNSFKIAIFILTVIFLNFSSIYAETITLKSGQIIEGKLIEKTDDYVRIDFQGVPLTYFLDDIKSIDETKQIPPLAKENKLSPKNNLASADAELLNVPYVTQFNNTACGAAALEMVYKYYGLSNVTQQEIYSKYCEIEPEFGRAKRISTDNLVADVQSRGFQAFYERVNYSSKEETLAVLRKYLDKKIPVIVCQQFTKKNPKIGHFRVVIGIDKENNVYLHDPKEGSSMKWPIDKFMDYWQPTGKNVTGGIYVVIEKSVH